MHIRLHPSILAADFVNLESELARIDGADAVHVDVMDNHFVPAIIFGAQMVGRIAQVSPIPLDVHLMIENPDLHAVTYADMGAQSVTFHVEAAKDSHAIISALHEAGSLAGVALKPGTALEPYYELFHEVDTVLLMTVEPGAGGQSFMPEMMPKLEALAGYLKDHGLTPLVEVDGGITTTTLPIALRSGANTFVAGSSVYGSGEPNFNIEALRACAH
ncbi:MAG: ribulose phosphate epimerase [Microbacteriaceae bacterium BACL25 MAG-120322-bin65]|jgi:ribulose-phosphate 3-epimerase|nr:MAG: ribulose phosphate epimerase [Microbacteriaceae bacterium BACL25 MAG-120322-bin65]